MTGRGHRSSETTDLLAHDRGEAEQVQKLCHPNPRNAKFGRDVGVRAALAAPEQLFTFIGENDRIPVLTDLSHHGPGLELVRRLEGAGFMTPWGTNTSRGKPPT